LGNSWWTLLTPPIKSRETATRAYLASTRQTLAAWAAVGIGLSAAWGMFPMVALPNLSINSSLLSLAAVTIVIRPVAYVFPRIDVVAAVSGNHSISAWHALIVFGMPQFFLSVAVYAVLSILAVEAPTLILVSILRRSRLGAESWASVALRSARIAGRGVAASSSAMLWAGLVALADAVVLVFLPLWFSDSATLATLLVAPMILGLYGGPCCWCVKAVACSHQIAEHLQRVRCVRCGYDLRGTPGDRCSECGMELPKPGLDPQDC
jgi:hypothetical protein